MSGREIDIGKIVEKHENFDFFSLKKQSQKIFLARARHIDRSGVGLRPAKGRKFFNPEKNVTFAMCFMTKNREIAKKREMSREMPRRRGIFRATRGRARGCGRWWAGGRRRSS